METLDDLDRYVDEALNEESRMETLDDLDRYVDEALNGLRAHFKGHIDLRRAEAIEHLRIIGLKVFAAPQDASAELMAEKALEAVEGDGVAQDNEGPSSSNRYGHDFSKNRGPRGYGVCSCGVRENTDEACEPCPDAAPQDADADGKVGGEKPLWRRLLALAYNMRNTDYNEIEWGHLDDTAEMLESAARRLRTDPEPDDPEGLVEEDPLEALELTDAEKADLYYRRWQGLREAAEAVCDFPMHDDDSPLAEAVRALRDRLQEAGDATD